MSNKFYHPLSATLSTLLANCPDGSSLAMGGRSLRINPHLSQEVLAEGIGDVMRALEHEATQKKEAGKLVPKEEAIDWDAHAVQARIVCEHFYEAFYSGTAARSEDDIAPVDHATVGAIAIKSGRSPAFVRAMMWLPPDLIFCRAGNFRKEFWAETAAKF